MMRVPESFVRLLPYPSVGSSEHKQHAEKHNMSCNTSHLGIMYLDRGLRSELVLLNVEKAVIKSVRLNAWSSLATHLT